MIDAILDVALVELQVAVVALARILLSCSRREDASILDCCTMNDEASIAGRYNTV